MISTPLQIARFRIGMNGLVLLLVGVKSVLTFIFIA